MAIDLFYNLWYNLNNWSLVRCKALLNFQGSYCAACLGFAKITHAARFLFTLKGTSDGLTVSQRIKFIQDLSKTAYTFFYSCGMVRLLFSLYLMYILYHISHQISIDEITNIFLMPVQQKRHTIYCGYILRFLKVVHYIL